MKSAVEWYYNAVNDIVIARINNKIDDELLIQNMLNAYLQAKEMEIKQAHDYAEFAIRCDRKNMKILNFDGYMNLETFKSE